MIKHPVNSGKYQFIGHIFVVKITIKQLNFGFYSKFQKIILSKISQKAVKKTPLEECCYYTLSLQKTLNPEILHFDI